MTTRSQYQLLWPTRPTRILQQDTFVATIARLNSSSKSNIIIGAVAIFQPIIIIILFLNLGRILPYAPSLTAHLVIDIRLCLPLWIRIILWSIIFPEPSIAHYLPEGTINSIAPFLSLVEGVRSIIRPLTLSFRLAANIRAGHVIIAIAGISSRVIILTSPKIRAFVIILGGGYFRFELAICLAQAFVLTLLGVIYINDYLTSPPKCGFSLKKTRLFQRLDNFHTTPSIN